MIINVHKDIHGSFNIYWKMLNINDLVQDIVNKLELTSCTKP